MFSPSGAPIAFFARIARRAEETLESIAAPKHSHVNDNSFKLASATPKMIGKRVKYTGTGNTWPRITPESTAETAGSLAFTMDTKLTAPAEREITAPMCVPRFPSATGSRVLTSEKDNFGVGRMPTVQRATAYGIPITICAIATVHGK